jgi:hypothetical protein
VLLLMGVCSARCCSFSMTRDLEPCDHYGKNMSVLGTSTSILQAARTCGLVHDNCLELQAVMAPVVSQAGCAMPWSAKAQSS